MGEARCEVSGRALSGTFDVTRRRRTEQVKLAGSTPVTRGKHEETGCALKNAYTVNKWCALEGTV